MMQQCGVRTTRDSPQTRRLAPAMANSDKARVLRPAHYHAYGKLTRLYCTGSRKFIYRLFRQPPNSETAKAPHSPIVSNILRRPSLHTEQSTMNLGFINPVYERVPFWVVRVGCYHSFYGQWRSYIGLQWHQLKYSRPCVQLTLTTQPMQSSSYCSSSCAYSNPTSPSWSAPWQSA